METWAWVALLVFFLVFGAAAAWWFLGRRRTGKLGRQLGAEYDRTVEQAGSTNEAEPELARREERGEHPEIRRLPDRQRERFADEWRAVQARFMDDPAGAIAEAAFLATEVMQARGYPVTDFDERAADLAVHHPHVVEHYRSARSIADQSERGPAATEELRQGMVHYRALFDELLERKSGDRYDVAS